MLTRVFGAAAVCVLACGAAHAQQSRSFTYQGSLLHQGEPYAGSADVVVRLWNAASGGDPTTESVFVDGVEVADGLFQIPLDFGAATFSQDRWVEIGVRTPAWDGQGAEPDYFIFPERQRVSAAPYALQTRGIFVNEQGNRVGIGTTEPARPLHVRSYEGILIGGAGTGDSALDMRLSSASGGYSRIQAVRFGGTQWGELALNPSGGRVGVGTTAPQALLHVEGNARIADELRAIGGVRFGGNGRIGDLVTREGTLNLAPLAPSETQTLGIVVPDASPGDIALLTLAPHVPGLEITHAWVNDDGVVSARLWNFTTNTIHAPPQTYRVTIIKP